MSNEVIIEEHIVYSAAQRHHRNLDDFFDGDLGERLERFTHYELKTMNIADLNLSEWDVDEDLVETYRTMDPSTMPPYCF